MVNRYEHERNCHRNRDGSDQSLRTLKVLLRWKVNNEVSDHGNRFSVTHTRRENPSGDNLKGLLLEIVSSGRQHRGFMYMTISADHAVYLNVVPGSCSAVTGCGAD